MEKIVLGPAVTASVYFKTHTDTGRKLAQMLDFSLERLENAENAVLDFKRKFREEAPEELYSEMYDADKCFRETFDYVDKKLRQWFEENKNRIEYVD